MSKYDLKPYLDEDVTVVEIECLPESSFIQLLDHRLVIQDTENPNSRWESIIIITAKDIYMNEEHTILIADGGLPINRHQSVDEPHGINASYFRH